MTEMTMLERMAEAMSAVDDDLFAVFPRGEELWNVCKLVDDEANELLDVSYVVVFTGERETCDHVASQLLQIARARAALEAMHEPTAAMLKAADDLADSADEGGWVDAPPRKVWPEMVVAALSEPTP